MMKSRSSARHRGEAGRSWDRRAFEVRALSSTWLRHARLEGPGSIGPVGPEGTKEPCDDETPIVFPKRG